jgi:ribosome-associated protein
MTTKYESSLEPYVKAVLGRKVSELVVLDVRGLTSIADTIIICSGKSNRQVVAIADHIKQELKKQDITLLGIEGKDEGHWILMDYGHVVIHVFYDQQRSFYNLEGLWIDAKRVQTKHMLELKSKD